MNKSFNEWKENQDFVVLKSKKRQVEALFEEIETAQKDGAKVWQIVSWLNQAHDLNISEKYLNTTLYRIRKERGQVSTRSKVSKEEQALTRSSVTETEINPYDLMMEKYKQCDNQVDKYVALGGKREDIEEQNISTQRNMVMTLRNQLRQKHKGIY